MDQITLIQEPRLDQSEQFNEMSERLRDSEAIFHALKRRGEIALDRMLTEALNEVVLSCRLAGMMIATEEGFPIAVSQVQGTTQEQDEVLAAICCLIAATVRRTEKEGLIPAVDQMLMRGAAGEQIILRFMPGLQARYFLVAWSKYPCLYRRATARALKLCSTLLMQAAETSKVTT